METKSSRLWESNTCAAETGFERNSKGSTWSAATGLFDSLVTQHSRSPGGFFPKTFKSYYRNTFSNVFCDHDFYHGIKTNRIGEFFFFFEKFNLQELSIVFLSGRSGRFGFRFVDYKLYRTNWNQNFNFDSKFLNKYFFSFFMKYRFFFVILRSISRFFWVLSNTSNNNY